MSDNEILKQIHKGIQELLEWKGALDERCEARGEKLSRVEQVLFGNPDPDKGLLARVQRLNGCKKSVTAWREFWLVVLQKVITWGIIAIIIFGLYLYKTADTEPNKKIENVQTFKQEK